MTDSAAFSHWQLSPNVAYTDAKDSGMLYDLHQGRLLQVPQGMHEMIALLSENGFDSQSCQALPEQSRQSLLHNLAELKRRGWLKQSLASFTLKTAHSVETFEGVNQLTLVFEDQEGFAEQAQPNFTPAQWLAIVGYLRRYQRLKLLSVSFAVLTESLEQLLVGLFRQNLIGVVELRGPALQLQRLLDKWRERALLERLVVNPTRQSSEHEIADEIQILSLFQTAQRVGCAYTCRSPEQAAKSPVPVVNHYQFRRYGWGNVFRGRLTLNSQGQLFAGEATPGAMIGCYRELRSLFRAFDGLAQHPLMGLTRANVEQCRDCGYRNCCSADHGIRCDDNNPSSRPLYCLEQVAFGRQRFSAKHRLQSQYFILYDSDGQLEPEMTALLDAVVVGFCDLYQLPLPSKKINFYLHDAFKGQHHNHFIGPDCNQIKTRYCDIFQSIGIYLLALNKPKANGFVLRSAARVFDIDIELCKKHTKLCCGNIDKLNESGTMYRYNLKQQHMAACCLDDPLPEVYLNMSLMLSLPQDFNLSERGWSVGASVVCDLITQFGHQAFNRWLDSSEPADDFEPCFALTLAQYQQAWRQRQGYA